MINHEDDMWNDHDGMWEFLMYVICIVICFVAMLGLIAFVVYLTTK